MIVASTVCFERFLGPLELEDIKLYTFRAVVIGCRASTAPKATAVPFTSDKAVATATQQQFIILTVRHGQIDKATQLIQTLESTYQGLQILAPGQGLKVASGQFWHFLPPPGLNFPGGHFTHLPFLSSVPFSHILTPSTVVNLPGVYFLHSPSRNSYPSPHFLNFGPPSFAPE